MGAWAARGRLVAYLSDFSAPMFGDVSVENFGNGYSTVYTLQYAAASAGKSLFVRYFVDAKYDSHGNVTLQAAALDTGNLPPSVTITNPSGDLAFLWPTNIFVAADAGDPDGRITKVEFFRDGVSFGQRTNPPYSAVWSNATVGSHALAATATDDRGATFTSRAATIFVGVGDGLLAVSAATPPPTVDLTAEGIVDWAYWGLAKSTSYDHNRTAATRISNWTKIGNGASDNYSNNFTGFSWTNGTPTAVAETTRTGIYREGLANGFQITVPADTDRKSTRLNSSHRT